jgi:hypothetical protein
MLLFRVELNANSDWATVAKKRNSLLFIQHEAIYQLACRVPMRPGCMVIWLVVPPPPKNQYKCSHCCFPVNCRDQRTPHGAAPNNSNRMRCFHTIKMFPAYDPPLLPLQKAARFVFILIIVVSNFLSITEPNVELKR